MNDLGLLYHSTLTGSQALPGKRCPEALPRSSSVKSGGRASGYVLPGRAWEQVKLPINSHSFSPPSARE